MAAHNSTHTGKQILLSQKEFPFWIEERREILKMVIKSNLGILLRGFSFKPESYAGNGVICAR